MSILSRIDDFLHRIFRPHEQPKYPSQWDGISRRPELLELERRRFTPTTPTVSMRDLSPKEREAHVKAALEKAEASRESARALVESARREVLKLGSEEEW